MRANKAAVRLIRRPFFGRRGLDLPPPLGSPRFARGTAQGASLGFPPLREGNRAGVRFPLHAGGTLRRGSEMKSPCTHASRRTGSR